MPQYYFDTETEGFNPKEHKLLTAQYQELDFKGLPKGNIVILKEWETGEENVVKSIHKLLLDKNVWSFIPILTNHIFDFTFLFEKFKQYKLPCPELADWLFSKPFLDLKYSLIMANGLGFKGSGLDQMTNKKTDGRMIPIWYTQKEYKKIEDYIVQEKDSFLEFFQESVQALKKIKYSIQDKNFEGDEDVTGNKYYEK